MDNVCEKNLLEVAKQMSFGASLQKCGFVLRCTRLRSIVLANEQLLRAYCRAAPNVLWACEYQALRGDTKASCPVKFHKRLVSALKGQGDNVTDRNPVITEERASMSRAGCKLI